MKIIIILTLLLSLGAFGQEYGDCSSDNPDPRMFCPSEANPEASPKPTEEIEVVFGGCDSAHPSPLIYCPPRPENDPIGAPIGAPIEPEIVEKPDRFKIIQLSRGDRCYLKQNDSPFQPSAPSIEYFCCSKADPSCRESERELRTVNCMITESEICNSRNKPAPIISINLDEPRSNQNFCRTGEIENGDYASKVSYSCCPKGANGCLNMPLITQEKFCPLQTEEFEGFRACLDEIGNFDQVSLLPKSGCSQLDGARCLSHGCGFESNNSAIRCPSGRLYSKEEQNFFSSFFQFVSPREEDGDVSKCSLDAQEVTVKCPVHAYNLVRTVEETDRYLIDDASSEGSESNDRAVTGAIGE